MHGQVGSQRAAFNVLVSVVDDVGKPVLGADTGFSWGPIGWTDSNYNRKNSDEMGVARFAGYARTDMYAYGATKQGYYPSRGIKGKFDKMDGARWQPWEEQLRVVLKPIKNPVPMYAKRISALLPEVVSKPLGYDLEKGDWIAPYGKGSRADFEFTAEGDYESKQNYKGKLTLRLPGARNGILKQGFDPSELKMPYLAPESGYKSEWVWRNERKTPPGFAQFSTFVDESNPEMGFIYRVRAVLDEEGRIIRANYGKIHGPVYFRMFEKGQSRIDFTYYYNSDTTRNLEFDPKKNLFPEEDVSEP